MASRLFFLPREIRALAFDMDLTLYTNPEYGQYQIDSLIERLGTIRGLSFHDMNREIEEKKKEWTLSHEGKKPSLSNILATYGIEMEENIRWREEIYKPELFIKEDLRLKATLEILSKSYKLGIVTNNSVPIAQRTLATLGVENFFSVLVGLNTCMVAKPHDLPFKTFAEFSGCLPGECVSIGDRYDIDLDIPLQMGMGGILVEGVEDVYELPAVL